MTAKKLVDDMYLKGNVITVTGKRIPHNMDGDDIIWEIKPRILMKGYQRLSAADRGNTSTEISGLESNLFVVKRR